MLRSRALATLFAGAALFAAGCGGDDSSGSPDAKQPASKDPAALLAGLTAPKDVDGAQKVSLALSLTPKGTPSNPTLSAFTDKPITATLGGVGSADGKKADLTFAVAAGPLNLDGALRVVGETSYVRVADSWYALPASTQGSGQASVDPAATLDALGNPNQYVKDVAYIGSEEVEGVASDHIRGTLDLPAFVQSASKAAATVQAGQAGLSEEQASQAADQLAKLITSSTADLWIGTEDKQLHKLSVDLSGALDDAMKASLGLDGFDANLTLTTVGTDDPDVEAPAGAKPASELQGALAGLLGGLGALAGSAAP